jgi:SAM-dependent methyltransferase
MSQGRQTNQVQQPAAVAAPGRDPHQGAATEATEAFVTRVIGDISGTAATVLAAIGDRLGLFQVLATYGPATSAELATRAGVDERYTREWLSGLTAARYLEYEPASRRFTLPAAYVPVLAQEGGSRFFGGSYQAWLGALGILQPLLDAFRHGGGVPFEEYSPDVWDGMARRSAAWFDHLLVQRWLPAVPAVQAALTRGALLADVGCGYGRALIRLAQAFPASRFVGYDVFAPNVARATEEAQEAGVGDRVHFEVRDVAGGLPEPFDVVTTFDVVHDAVAPRALLRAIRQGLRADGTYLCLEFSCPDALEADAGDPLAAVGYAGSLLYCLTTSLAHGGEGLGARGLPERKVRELCAEAGFSRVGRAPLEDPFNVLYVIEP